ncbi:MAG TPA: ThiF family adenylyltransferase [Actinomycetota bacterium]|nr:ThiF family adenylyltransferase [Actinomycetota bacterium]
MTSTLVVPTWIAEEIAQATRDQRETAGVILAGLARTEVGLRLLAREVHWVTEGSYEHRTSTSLSILSSGYVRALARAADTQTVPIWLHTHPGADAVPKRSTCDEEVDDNLAETFRIRSGSEVYASVVVSPAEQHVSPAEQHVRFSGMVVDGDQSQPLDRFYRVGPRWSLLAAEDASTGTQVPTMFDRQVRAFGGALQRVLSNLRVAVVGCGGTGSAVAEQLVRLGIRSLLVIDPDEIIESNVTRVYGSTPATIGLPKADVLAHHLRLISPDGDIQPVRRKITDEVAARRLTACDLVFGCTDDNAGRLVLSRLSAYYLVPLIDIGVLISSTDGVLQGIDGRITVVTPGEGCLVCRGRIDTERARAEQLEPAERGALQAEGYAPELGVVEPSVVPYTSLVASLAVTEVVERLVGYGPDPEPGEVLVRFHDRELSTNNRAPNRRHYCNPDDGQLGLGDRSPFLGQTWRE